MANFDLIGGTRIADFVCSNRPVDVIQGPLGSGKTRGLLFAGLAVLLGSAVIAGYSGFLSQQG